MTPDGFTPPVSIVAELIATQFPQWADLPVRPVDPGGWDNRTYRLGDEMSVRFPSAEAYVPQVEKEHRWLPVLLPRLPLPIPTPVALGAPGGGYPWRWSVYGWIEGETTTRERVTDLRAFAADLGAFLTAVHRIDSTGGPPPGPHNFHRGGSLRTYDAETHEAIRNLEAEIDAVAVARVWEAALASTWEGPPVWVHGDVAPSNLLVRDGALCAVIDFGSMGVGDPACDLAIAWAFFSGESRAAFRDALPLDAGTWNRARGWALWKALIMLAGCPGPAADGPESARRTIQAILDD